MHMTHPSPRCGYKANVRERMRKRILSTIREIRIAVWAKKAGGNKVVTRSIASKTKQRFLLPAPEYSTAMTFVRSGGWEVT